MVIQTKKFYLIEYFQYKVDCKKAKAKFIADKYILELIFPIIRNDEFWIILNYYCFYLGFLINFCVLSIF